MTTMHIHDGEGHHVGGVWAVEVEPSYYEPVMVFEIRRV